MIDALRTFVPRRWASPDDAAQVDLDGRRVSWRRSDGAPHELGRLEPSRWLVVALHGLGASERQIATLVPLDVDGVVVAPRAPHPRGRDGWSWTAAPGAEDASALAAAADGVADYVRWAAATTGVGPGRTAVLGHSQGAAIAAAVGIRHPGLADAVVLTTAALPGGLASLAGAGPRRAFVAVGLRDGLVDPVALACLRERWRRAGTLLTTRDYDVPHVVSPEVAADVSTWIEAGEHG